MVIAVPLRFPALPPHFPLEFALERPVPGAGAARVLTLRGYRQVRNYSCGFASAWMVARHHRPHADPRALYEGLGTSRDGTRQTAIVRELRALGLSANVRYDVDFRRIRLEIDRGKPLIGYLHDDHHWVVVYGYASGPDRVFVADPHPGEPCVYPWNKMSRRLRRFGIVCGEGRAAVAPAERAPASSPVVTRPSILLGPSSLAFGGRSAHGGQQSSPRGDQLALPLCRARVDKC